MTKKIVTLSGDGIGPEIMAAGLEVLEKVASKIGFDYDIDAKPFGGAGIDAEGHPLPKSTLDAAKQWQIPKHKIIKLCEDGLIERVAKLGDD